jgi:hypothetical protein
MNVGGGVHRPCRLEARLVCFQLGEITAADARVGERQIDIAGCEQESDKQRFKGDPHDVIVFDEDTDFLESQYRFIIGWNRSTDPGKNEPRTRL